MWKWNSLISYSINRNKAVPYVGSESNTYSSRDWVEYLHSLSSTVFKICLKVLEAHHIYSIRVLSWVPECRSTNAECCRRQCQRHSPYHHSDKLSDNRDGVTLPCSRHSLPLVIYFTHGTWGATGPSGPAPTKHLVVWPMYIWTPKLYSHHMWITVSVERRVLFQNWWIFFCF